MMYSYSTGAVLSNKEGAGGLLGSNSWNDIVAWSYWDIETSGQLNSADGVGKTTEEMKQIETYQYWDFEEVWDIVENETYPFLRN